MSENSTQAIGSISIEQQADRTVFTRGWSFPSLPMGVLFGLLLMLPAGLRAAGIEFATDTFIVLSFPGLILFMFSFLAFDGKKGLWNTPKRFEIHHGSGDTRLIFGKREVLAKSITKLAVFSKSVKTKNSRRYEVYLVCLLLPHEVITVGSFAKNIKAARQYAKILSQKLGVPTTQGGHIRAFNEWLTLAFMIASFGLICFFMLSNSNPIFSGVWSDMGAAWLAEGLMVCLALQLRYIFFPALFQQIGRGFLEKYMRETFQIEPKAAEPSKNLLMAAVVSGLVTAVVGGAVLYEYSTRLKVDAQEKAVMIKRWNRVAPGFIDVNGDRVADYIGYFSDSSGDCVGALDGQSNKGIWRVKMSDVEKMVLVDDTVVLFLDKKPPLLLKAKTGEVITSMEKHRVWKDFRPSKICFDEQRPSKLLLQGYRRGNVVLALDLYTYQLEDMTGKEQCVADKRDRSAQLITKDNTTKLGQKRPFPTAIPAGIRPYSVGLVTRRSTLINGYPKRATSALDTPNRKVYGFDTSGSNLRWTAALPDAENSDIAWDADGETIVAAYLNGEKMHIVGIDEVAGKVLYHHKVDIYTNMTNKVHEVLIQEDQVYIPFGWAMDIRQKSDGKLLKRLGADW